jgi:hypothetical protein
LDDEIAELKESNGRKLWFNFDTGCPGVLFIKLIDWARPHIDSKKIGV